MCAPVDAGVSVDDDVTVDDDCMVDDDGTVDCDGTVGDCGTVDHEDDGESILLEDEIVQNESQENEPVVGQDKTRADKVTENEKILDTIEFSKGWIKSVIFDREWKEPSAKVQLISRIKVNNLMFLRIYDGSDNTGQCCIDE